MAELNLIPSSMKNKHLQKNKRMNMLFMIIIILSGLFFALYIPYLKLQQLQNRESALKLQVDAQYNIIEERNKMTDQINSTNELISIVNNIDTGRQLVYKYIIDLQKIVPSDIKFTSLNYADGLTTISGITENYNSPAVFVANLLETGTYKNVELVNITKNESDYMFNISIERVK